MIGIMILSMVVVSVLSSVRCENISHIQVFRDHDVHLSCSDDEVSSNTHLWWFRGEIVYSQNLPPDELQLENVFGNMSNGSNSFLHIYHFTDENEGYYNCTKLKERVIIVYHLSLTEASLHLTYNTVQVSNTLVLNESDMSHLQCHVDPMSKDKMHYMWEVNGSKTSGRVKTENVSFENKHIEVSTYSINRSAGDQNVTCLFGNLSRTVFVKVNQDTQPVPTSDAGILSTTIFDTEMFQYVLVGIGSVLCLIFVTFVCKTIKRKLCNRGSLNYQDEMKASPIQGGHYRYSARDVEEVSSFYGSLPELYTVTNSYEESSSGIFPRENICFNNNLPTSLMLLYWTATLTHRRDKIQDVMVAYVEADAPVEAKLLWKNCSDSRLSISDHPNLLKAIGYCKYEGVLFLISDYFEMNPLDKYLVSEYSNFDVSVDEFTGYALDIIDGMEFLNSVGCAHPSLSAGRILVNHLGICKLYDFCPLNQALEFLEIFLKEDGDFEWRTAPEVASSRTYTELSDVWAVGMTLWELFFGGHSKLHGILQYDEYYMQQQLQTIEKPPECPSEIFTAMMLCLNKQPDHRPTMIEVKSTARKNKAIGTQSSLYIKMKDRTATQANEVHYVEDPTIQYAPENDILYDSLA